MAHNHKLHVLDAVHFCFSFEHITPLTYVNRIGKLQSVLDDAEFSCVFFCTLAFRMLLVVQNSYVEGISNMQHRFN